METWDAIRARRNVREYADRPIAAGDLDRILEAARRSPSSMNEQPWDFVVVTDRDRLTRLAQVWRYGAHLAADLGIGSCHSAVGDQALVREILDLPQDRECVVLLSLGYPAGRPLAPIEDPSRRPFDDVVHRDRW